MNKTNLKSNKFKKIVESANDLFSRYGIRRVSIEEICKTANVSKMTFYKHFPNKTELAKYILTGYINEGMKRYDEILSADEPFTQKMKEFAQYKLELIRKLNEEFALEFIHSDNPEIQKFLDRKRKESIAFTNKFYTDAQKKGEIRPEIKPQFIEYILHTMAKMSEDKNLIGLYTNMEEFTRELFNFFLFGIISKEGQDEI